MSESMESQNEKNSQATTSLILGIGAVVFSLFNLAPGLLSTLGCVGIGAALFAFVSGVQGLRAAKELDGQGRTMAIIGMVAGGIGLLVSVAIFFGSFLEVQGTMLNAIATATAQAP